jgi:hypothetical protein
LILAAHSISRSSEIESQNHEGSAPDEPKPEPVLPTPGVDRESATWPVDVDFRAALKWLGVLAGQATLLGALFFYVGWVRTQSLLQYFGLNNNIVNLSWNDYILRSPNVVIRGLTLICALSLLLVIGGASAWTYLAPRAADHPWLSRGTYALATVTLTFGLLGYFNVLTYSRTIPFVPLIIVLAAALFAFGAAFSSAADKTRSEERAHHPAIAILVVLTTILCGFWAASVYATQTGQELAESIERFPTQRSRVAIYAESDLGLAPPVICTNITASRYTRRCSGLRLLIYAPEKYILIPDNWSRGHDPVYIISDDPSIRVEITSS